MHPLQHDALLALHLLLGSPEFATLGAAIPGANHGAKHSVLLDLARAEGRLGLDRRVIERAPRDPALRAEILRAWDSGSLTPRS